MAVTTVASSLRWGCEPVSRCLGELAWVGAGLAFAGIPLAIMAGGGLGLVILASNNTRARRLLARLFVGVAAVFLTLHMFALGGAFEGSQAPVAPAEEPTTPGPNSPY